eukprot:403336430
MYKLLILICLYVLVCGANSQQNQNLYQEHLDLSNPADYDINPRNISIGEEFLLIFNNQSTETNIWSECDSILIQGCSIQQIPGLFPVKMQKLQIYQENNTVKITAKRAGSCMIYFTQQLPQDTLMALGISKSQGAIIAQILINIEGPIEQLHDFDLDSTLENPNEEESEIISKYHIAEEYKNEKSATNPLIDTVREYINDILKHDEQYIVGSYGLIESQDFSEQNNQ